MGNWGGIGLLLACVTLFLYFLFTDKNPRSFNPRPFVNEDRRRLGEFRYKTFIVFASALVGFYLLIGNIRWAWIRW
jgi:hypothetical protein